MEYAAHCLMSQGGQGERGERAKRVRVRQYAVGSRGQCEEAGFWGWRGGKRGCSAGLAEGGGSRRLLQGYGRSVHPAISYRVLRMGCKLWLLGLMSGNGGRATLSPSRGGPDGPELVGCVSCALCAVQEFRVSRVTNGNRVCTCPAAATLSTSVWLA